MAYTGGPLNELNGKMGISAPYKSVAVMKLIRYHKPKSKDELVELIRDIQLIPTLYFLKTAKYQIVLREKWSWRII